MDLKRIQASWKNMKTKGMTPGPVFTNYIITGVLRGSLVKCLIHNSGVLDSSRTGSSEFFVGVSLGKTLQSTSLVLE